MILWVYVNELNLLKKLKNVESVLYRTIHNSTSTVFCGRHGALLLLLLLLLTGGELVVPAGWVHHRQTGSDLAIELNTAALQSLTTSTILCANMSVLFNFQRCVRCSELNLLDRISFLLRLQCTGCNKVVLFLQSPSLSTFPDVQYRNGSALNWADASKHAASKSRHSTANHCRSFRWMTSCKFSAMPIVFICRRVCSVSFAVWHEAHSCPDI